MATESNWEGGWGVFFCLFVCIVLGFLPFCPVCQPSKISCGSKCLLSEFTRWTWCYSVYLFIFFRFQTHLLYIFFPFFRFCHGYTNKSMAICRAKIFSYDLLLNPSPGLHETVRKEKKNQQWCGIVSLGDLSLRHCTWYLDQGRVFQRGKLSGEPYRASLSSLRSSQPGGPQKVSPLWMAANPPVLHQAYTCSHLSSHTP